MVLDLRPKTARPVLGIDLKIIESTQEQQIGDLFDNFEGIGDPLTSIDLLGKKGEKEAASSRSLLR